MLAVLQPDLRSLSVEGRRKFPDIKNAAERAEMRLRSFEDQYKAEEDFERVYLQAVVGAKDIIQPFILALETKNTKLVAIAVGSLQKLFSRNAVAVNDVPGILRAISNHLDNTDETILLKILQAIVALLTSQISIHHITLSSALSICIHLNLNRNSIVRNTAGASLKQVATNLIERAIAETKAGSPVNIEDEETYVHDAYYFVLDICRLTRTDNPSWLKIKELSLPIGMEMLESVLSANPSFFIEHTAFLTLLKDQVFPLVVQTFKQSHNFIVILRLLRLINCIIQNFSKNLAAESEVFLCRLVRMIKPDGPKWLNALVLEIFSIYFNHEELLVALFVNYDMAEGTDSESKILHNVLNAITQYVQFVSQEQTKIESSSNQSSISRKNTRNVKVLELLNYSEAPSLDIYHMRSLCAEISVRMIDSLYRLVLNEGLLVPLSQGENKDSPDLERINVLRNLCTVSWPALLGSLSTLSNIVHGVKALGSLFNAFQNFVIVCCVLQLETPRDAFITSITKASIPRKKDISMISKRNVTAMKVLLQMAHNLGNILSMGWNLILQSVYSLSMLITSPQLQQLVQMREMNSTTQPKDSPASQRRAIDLSTDELGELVSTLDNLFDNSSQLSEESMIFLLEGLYALNTDKFIESDASSLPPKPFSLSKLEEVVMQNLQRAETIWDSLFEHMKLSVQHSHPTIRSCGADSLGRIIVSMFSYFSNVPITSPTTGATITNSLTQDEQTLETQIYMQNRLLEALEENSRSKYNDVRQKTLEALNQVLQSSGQTITKGWPLILSILMTIAVNHDKPHIVYGFNSVSLICTDFLTNLPLDCLALFITTIGCYGLQSAEINVSLTGIGLLLSIADFLGKDSGALSQPLHSDDHAEAFSDPQDIHIDENGPLFAHAPVARLWISLFTEMKQLCLDQRFEVRNCSLITLVKTFTTHGQSLEPKTWHQCIWDIFFPMLEDIQASTSAAATDEVTVELGKQGGRSVKLLVHHSRNSVQKQWNETVLLSFGGLTRVVRTFATKLISLDSFNSIWEKMINMGEQLILEQSQEVSESVIGNLRELLSSVATLNTFSRKQWDPIWCVFKNITNVYASSATKPIETTLTAISNSILYLYSNNHSYFTENDEKCWLHILKELSVTSRSTNPNLLSAVQRDLLECIKIVEPPSNQLHLELFESLVFVICNISAYNRDTKDAGTAIPELFFYADHLLKEISRLFTVAPDEIKAKALKGIIEATGSCLTLKYSHNKSYLWKNSISVFLDSLLALPLIQKHCTEKQCEDTWSSVHQFTEIFLFDVRWESNAIQRTLDEKVQESSFDLKILESLARVMLPCEAKNIKIHTKLIQILITGSQCTAKRELVSLQCYSELFALACAQDASNIWEMKLAQQAAPLLMNRVSQVLKKFIETEGNSGKLPVSRDKLTEIIFVLKQLKNATIHPSLSLVQKETLSVNYSASNKKHLLYLFPLLCECITTREETVKPLLKHIFHLTASEVGLE